MQEIVALAFVVAGLCWIGLGVYLHFIRKAKLVAQERADRYNAVKEGKL